MTNPVQLRVSSVEVRAAQPKAADLRKIKQLGETRNRSAKEIVYLVKLFMDDVEPLYRSLGFRLFVGNKEIEKYAGFKHGIYFKILDPDFLTGHAGEKIQFTTNGLEFIEAGVNFPDDSANTQVAGEAAMANGLPSQEQVLGE